MADLYCAVRQYLSPIVKRYARLQTNGLDNLPKTGALLACNHSGGMWWDAVNLVTAIPNRKITFVAHYWDGDVAPIRAFLDRLGSRYLDKSMDTIDKNNSIVQDLKAGALMCIYPEESYHTIRDRYTLFNFKPQVFKYAKLAGVPIIPTCVIGAEEASPTLYGIKRANIPWHIPLHPPIILPFKISIRFGKPHSYKHWTGKGSNPKFLTDTDYTIGATNLRRDLFQMMSEHRNCHMQDEDYIDKVSLL